MAKEGGDPRHILKEICRIVQGPVSGEVVATDAEGMIREGRELAKLDEHIVVKVPFTREGVKACKALSSEGTPVNVTLIFRDAGAAGREGRRELCEPFVGRLDDIATDGMLHLIEEIVEIFDNYEFGTEVLVSQLPPPDSHRHRGEAGRRHLHVPAGGARSAVQAPADRHRAGKVPEGLGEVAGGGTVTNDE
jgi:transaldolase